MREADAKGGGKKRNRDGDGEEDSQLLTIMGKGGRGGKKGGRGGGRR